MRFGTRTADVRNAAYYGCRNTANRILSQIHLSCEKFNEKDHCQNRDPERPFLDPERPFLDPERPIKKMAESKEPDSNVS